MRKTIYVMVLGIFITLLASGCMSKTQNEVNIYMWGGSSSINEYMDNWVIPNLKETKGITLKRVPINSPVDIINKLVIEKQSGKINGSVDIIWLNGENFKKAKDGNILWKPFTNSLSNFNKFVDTKSNDIKYDFGEATNGLEAPWGKVQFVFIYDSSKIKNPPKSFKDLLLWVKKNPGRFTYPAPPDFTGSAFLRHGLFELSGGYAKYLKDMGRKTFDKNSNILWDYLHEVKPYLWQQGKTYPESLSKLDQLYSSGEVWMTMGYDEARASNEIKKGNFPQTTKTFLLREGTLSNTHFLTIPFNAPNENGAKDVINFLLSPDAQISKYDPKVWGDGLSVDFNKLSNKDKDKVKSINRGESTLNINELQKHRLPEIRAEYVDYLVKGWVENVAKN